MNSIGSILVDGCSDYESCNLNFHATWRRLGRGVRVAGYSEKLIVAFVSASETKEALEVVESGWLVELLCDSGCVVCRMILLTSLIFGLSMATLKNLLAISTKGKRHNAN